MLLPYPADFLTGDRGMGKRIFDYWKTGAAGVILAAGMLMMPVHAQAVEQEYTQEITVEKKNAETEIQGSEEQGEETGKVRASDLSEFTNTLEMLPLYGSTVNTYLEATSGGWRAVLVDGAVHIIDFDRNWNQKSEKRLEYELPVFGAYYSGKTYNYLVYGQKGSSRGTVIYKVVKYDKNFKRLSELSVPYEECYTTVPFYDGNVSVAESGNQMVVYTARKRPDGHQSNIALRINTDTMTISNDYGMIAFPDIHVSHSFREIVKYDGNTPVYVDLGDGSPRAVCLQEDPGIYTNMLSVPGEDGDNNTDTDVSGFEVTDTGYLVVGLQKKNYCNNVYLSYAKKGELSAKVTWLTGSTSYNYLGVANARIVKIQDGKYAVMWNSYSGGNVNYVIVDGQGETISGLKQLEDAELTQCQPVYSEGKISWLKYSDGERKVFEISDLACTGKYELTDTYVEPVDPWNGTADTGWYQENKTEFTVNTPAQLAGLAKLVNGGNSFEGKKVCLGKDMFFNQEDSIKNVWIPIASEESGMKFQGIFEGQGHSLYNLYIPAGSGGGLFGRIGEKGIVRGVNVSQGVIEEAASVAAINDGWILFCENNSLILNYESDYVGGVCGENNNMVYGCGNTGVVQAGTNGGGVVGRTLEKGGTVDSCWNEGHVVSGGGIVAGVLAVNYGWISDCYNAGTVCGSLWYNYAKTVAGVVGENLSSDIGNKHRVRNCYNAGHLDINEEWNAYFSDAVCGASNQDGYNLYTTPCEYTVFSKASVVSVNTLKSEEMAEKLRGGEAVLKWQTGVQGINNGMAVPVARADIEKGIYKMLPDVWGTVLEFDIGMQDQGYQLKPFSAAYYGLEEGKAVFSSDSDILSVTKSGVVTPKKTGTAKVKVIFEESDYAKQTGFEVTVNISGIKGDVDGNGKVNIADLRMVLRSVCNKVELTDAQKNIADVEKNGKVDVQDLRKILRFLCGKIDNL